MRTFFAEESGEVGKAFSQNPLRVLVLGKAHAILEAIQYLFHENAHAKPRIPSATDEDSRVAEEISSVTRTDIGNPAHFFRAIKKCGRAGVR